MKQGITVNGEIITLSGNTVKEISENHVKQITFLNEQQAKEYFKRYNVCKARGRKKLHTIPQATIYYNQLIIQL